MRDNYGFEIEDPQVLEILDHTKMPNKAIQGTPWYSILSNPEYCDSFAYIGSYIDEREKLIKDGDACQDNNTDQSDIVMVLLCLSYIPDEVAQKFTFDHQFRETFLKNMKEFRKTFEKRYGIKWEFSNDQSIDRYITFKRSRQKLMMNLDNSDFDPKKARHKGKRYYDNPRGRYGGNAMPTLNQNSTMDIDQHYMSTSPRESRIPSGRY
jgi:hypothetical protein